MKFIIVFQIIICFAASAMGATCSISATNASSVDSLTDSSDIIVVASPSSVLAERNRSIDYKMKIHKVYKGVEFTSGNELTISWDLFDGTKPLQLNTNYLMFLNNGYNGNPPEANSCGTVKAVNFPKTIAAVDRIFLLRSTTVAILQSEDGFTTEDLAEPHGFRIMVSGEIKQFDSKGTRTVSRISGDQLKALLGAIQNQSQVSLEDTNAHAPMWVDTGKSFFAVYKNGVEIKLVEKYGGEHSLEPKGGIVTSQPAIYQAYETLNELGKEK